jgi:predicted AAA+ superfamily ATPase
MKSWREIAVPHRDVLEGTFQQSEFAADITAVRAGRATREYQDPAAFFERTFITEGMRLLLVQVAQRLNGRGGEPVIQLQTAFGGGKTHTMLAVYHLATRACPLKDLAGIPPLLDLARVSDVPRAAIAVLDGGARGPGQPWTIGDLRIRTLWGELAWQLGHEEGYALVREADESGTSPGKEALRTLLERFGPCVVLIDELVAYIRQFPEGQVLTGGTYESNVSFVQALTEAAKLVPNAVVLASLPESESETGGDRGRATLRALEKLVGRVHALWKPVATEEAFEIVRRRLFEPIHDVAGRDEVCRAFAKAYADEGTRVPSETHETRYADRLRHAYPIHPEIFDRLYQDWTTLDGFQRTRGVLKLMARVIYRLWKDQNQDLMILPGALPLHDTDTRNDLVYYLEPGWDAVLERDIDGDRAETTDLDVHDPRFGALSAARRVARTLFLGSAPAAGGSHKGVRGIDRARVLLGCLQPGQASATYSDALNRLVDRLHYLNPSGDKALDTTRFWFDTRANLRREMEDRKGRFDEQGEVRPRIAEALRKLVSTGTTFDGVHIFTPSADVPDDAALRLVVLPVDAAYTKTDTRAALDAVAAYVEQNGTRPRYRGNRLVFVAAEASTLGRLRDAIRTALAWTSIVKDIDAGRLNIDRAQADQAKETHRQAEEVAQRVARECFKWLLCPVQHSATDREISVEAFPLNTAGSAFSAEVDRVCADNELVIRTWSPIHLGTTLRNLYWKPDRPAARALAVWEDMLKYTFMPRLRSRSVLEQAIAKGAATKDFFGTAYGEASGTYQGFQLGGSNVQVDDTLLLIEPNVARAYEEAHAAPPPGPKPTSKRPSPVAPGPGTGPGPGPAPAPGPAAPKLAKSFFGSVEVSAATAKMKLVTIADEVIALLAQDPTATVRVTVEISADFPAGAPEPTKRAVSENAASLAFSSKAWE